MARIGQRLRDARTAKGISLERVAEDTNIGLRYLAGLENDDHKDFPGEPYVVGFMRNYAEYLGLDGPAMIAEYRRHEPPNVSGAAAEISGAGTAGMEGAAGNTGADDAMADDGPATASSRSSASQEIPTSVETPAKAPKPRKKLAGGGSGQNAASSAAAAEPIASAPKRILSTETLVDAASGQASEAGDKKSVSRFIPIIVAALFIAVLALALGFLNRRNAGGEQSDGSEAGTHSVVEYRVEGLPFEKRLYVGDSLVIGVGQDLYKIRLAGIDEAVDFETPFGPLRINLGEEGAIDPDNDGEIDVALVVTDFARKNASSGALVRAEARTNELSDPASTSEVQIAPEASQPSAAGQTGVGSTPTYLFRSTRGPYPFVTTVTFRGPCMFRYESDRREWVEKYYSKGETLTINANNTLVLWASNAQAARISVQASGGKTADLEMGGPGEIAVKRLSWSQAEGAWTLGAADAD